MKTILAFFMILFCAVVSAQDFSGIKIYLNPGHGGYDSDDRNVRTIPYAMGDTLGFWESSSNLRKGLALRDMLQSANATVLISRTGNKTTDDRSLSEIAEEANANNVDAFLSIHSNALGVNTGTNYLLLLYHGYDNQPTVENSLPMVQAAWPRLLSNQLTVWTHYATSTNYRGDFSFYGNTSGLGVLRPLTVPGFLAETSFHDYQPETHRLLNPAYSRLDAVNFYRYFCDYFQAAASPKGVIAGTLKSSNERMNNSLYAYISGSDDQWKPLNGSKVKLMNQLGDSLSVFNVDTLNNGVFAFFDLDPGTYKLRFDAAGYTAKDTTIVVEAAKTTYVKTKLVNPSVVEERETPPDYPNPDQEAGAVPLNHYDFDTSPDVAQPDWLQSHTVRRVAYRNEKYYVLTDDSKILVANAATNAFIKELDLTGVEGGARLLSDIAFTSDGYLVACNKDSLALPESKGRYFKVYIWKGDDASPELLFKTQNQANWTTGVVGETFAVSGSSWNCKVYTPSVTTGSSKAIRIMGFAYEEGYNLGYKYMLDATNYTEAKWGKGLKFTISPSGGEYFYLDSEAVLPTEYRFNWSADNRAPLENIKVFAETDGYALEKVASGNFFFRHAGHVFMSAPDCKADSTEVGIVLFDVTKGVDKALKVSDKLPASGLGVAGSSFMASAALVQGYDIVLMALAKGLGVGRYKTIAQNTAVNIYASELSCVTEQSQANLKFTLNGNANSVQVNIYKDSELVKTIDLGAMTKGVQNINVDLGELQNATYDWSITASASAIDRPVKITDNAESTLQFYSPRGVAVDNEFESSCFGRVYASETVPGKVTSRTTQDGIYILNSAMEDVTGQGQNSYAGGITWGAGSSPMRLSVAPDGFVYVSDWSDTHSGVWSMNPEDPSAPFTEVFAGLTRDSKGLAKNSSGVNVHGSIAHLWVTGTGTDKRLFTFDEDYVDALATSTGNLLQYNIGSQDLPWQSAPSAVVYNDALNGNLQQNMNSCIAPDGRNGWWISQYRTADAEAIPCLIHVNEQGAVDFNSGKTPALIANSYTGGMAVSYDGTRLAMGCNNQVKIFQVTFSDQNVPTLALIHSIAPAMGTNTAGLAYDRAGNVYVISNSSERLGVWSLPKSENSFTTPASSKQRIVIGSTTGVDSPVGSDIEVSVYPTLATDRITVESKNSPIKSYTLYSLNGQTVKQQAFAGNSTDNKIVITLEGLNSKVYLLKIQTDKGSVVKRILIK
jgi:N-acetylmuramoyl-L-alanine amidase